MSHKKTAARPRLKATIPVKAKAGLFIACFFWAISFVATKQALEVIPPLSVVAFRLFISSICFLLWLLIRRVRFSFKLNFSWLIKFLILSLFGTGLHYSTQTIGIDYTTASNASVFAATGPLCIFLIAWIFLGEKINLTKILGIICSLAGIVLVIGIDTIKSFHLGGHLFGDILVFGSIFMWALFTILSKKMIGRKLGSVEITAIITFLGTLYMIPAALLEMKQHHFTLSRVTPEAFWSVIFLGVTCSFLATLLYVWALEKTESQKVGMYLYTIPPLTCLFSVIFLKEALTIGLIAGIPLVLAGVYITERG